MTLNSVCRRWAWGIIPAAGGKPDHSPHCRAGLCVGNAPFWPLDHRREAKKIKMVNRVRARVELLPTVEKLADVIRNHDWTALDVPKRRSSKGWNLPAGSGPWNWKPVW